MPTDTEARQRISDILTDRMARDGQWRKSFAEAVAGLFYEAVHTDCPPDCVCHTNQLPDRARRWTRDENGVRRAL